ncbi:MAG: hypothetical protein IJF67_06535 [Clostridia bacterium]|nr:hypothetical protein [Clostridia bacterium]
MKTYTYHPQAMHLHAANQMGASMESHIANAAALGMHYIRLTGHDVRMGRRKYEIDRFDFTRHALEYEDYPKQTIRLEPLGDIAWRFDGDALVLWADSEAGVTLTASGKRQTRPLASDVTLTLGITGDARVRLDVTLSQRPKSDGSPYPTHEPAHYIYELDPKKSVHILHVSADIPAELGGLDNSLAGLTLFVSGGTARIDRLEIASANDAQTVLEIQRRTAEAIGARYGVKPFVTCEISDAGQHKCVYSTRVPLLDYAAANYRITAAEAVAHLRKFDAVYAYNHPFERWKRMELSDEAFRAQLLDVTAAELVAAKVWGAQVMEVGFPAGRCGFTLDEHLRLWDFLSMAGIFITGDGDSDSHHAHLGWFSGNNFATWIAADADMPFPVTEAEFEASLRAGRAYMGDPMVLRGQAEFTADGCPMGAVFVHTDATMKETHRFRFACKTEPGWRVRVINDGAVLREAAADADEISLEFELAPRLTVSFVRVEMYNSEGRCILLTNPIYMVNSDNFAGELPACRIYGGAE